MLKRSDFDAGKPHSCWLRGELSWEIKSYLKGYKNRGLVEKYGAKVDDNTVIFIMEKMKRFDDLPDKLQKIAIDIIWEELGEILK